MCGIYSLFSVSTSLWGLISFTLSDTEPKLPLPKRLSDTRCSARADPISALYKGYSVIMNVLRTLLMMTTQIRGKAASNWAPVVYEKIGDRYHGCSWDNVLQRFQQTSASLQASDQDLNTACALWLDMWEN